MIESQDDARHGPPPSSIWGDETPVVDAVVGWAAQRVVTASDPKWTARPASEPPPRPAARSPPRGSGTTRRCACSGRSSPRDPSPGRPAQPGVHPRGTHPRGDLVRPRDQRRQRVRGLLGVRSRGHPRREPGARLDLLPARLAAHRGRRVRLRGDDRQPLSAGRRTPHGRAAPRAARRPLAPRLHLRRALLDPCRGARHRRGGRGVPGDELGRLTGDRLDAVLSVPQASSPSSPRQARPTAVSSTISPGLPTPASGTGSGCTSTARTAVPASRHRRCATSSPGSSAPTASSSTRTSGCSRRTTRARWCIGSQSSLATRTPSGPAISTRSTAPSGTRPTSRCTCRGARGGCPSGSASPPTAPTGTPRPRAQPGYRPRRRRSDRRLRAPHALLPAAPLGPALRAGRVGRRAVPRLVDDAGQGRRHPVPPHAVAGTYRAAAGVREPGDARVRRPRGARVVALRGTRVTSVGDLATSPSRRRRGGPAEHEALVIGQERWGRLLAGSSG